MRAKSRVKIGLHMPRRSRLPLPAEYRAQPPLRIVYAQLRERRAHAPAV